jgi:hypothetical protein
MREMHTDGTEIGMAIIRTVSPRLAANRPAMLATACVESSPVVWDADSSSVALRIRKLNSDLLNWKPSLKSVEDMKDSVSQTTGYYIRQHANICKAQSIRD